MGKRSSFDRIPRDYYPTPYEPVKKLIPFLELNDSFCEPCAGDGRLIEHLKKHGFRCLDAWDIEPMANGIEKKDAKTEKCKVKIDYFVTNPPWDRKILHPIIENLRIQAPTWLLFDADWAHTKQAKPFLKYCDKIVSVGRVKWIEESKMTGKDNCAWYLFLPDECETKFYNL